ncbi:10972_t:CDS:10 [Ambispora leptoticha]|uniref:Cytosine-specific methyltransferase n=1 Tax=Ambispora leptoticha TaxID=144679 RepID=A0A9N8W5Z7_9GLOM|nr:10972_t:CDS:10 [Ambispora leptoticha]
MARSNKRKINASLGSNESPYLTLDESESDLEIIENPVKEMFGKKNTEKKKLSPVIDVGPNLIEINTDSEDEVMELQNIPSPFRIGKRSPLTIIDPIDQNLSPSSSRISTRQSSQLMLENEEAPTAKEEEWNSDHMEITETSDHLLKDAYSEEIIVDVGHNNVVNNDMNEEYTEMIIDDSQRTNKYDPQIPDKTTNIKVVMDTNEHTDTSICVKVPFRNKAKNAFLKSKKDKNIFTESDHLYIPISDLHEVRGDRTYYWNATVTIEDEDFEWEEVPLKEISIGGYGIEISEITIWFRSSKDKNLWYRLKNPHPEYEKIFQVFHWKATLAKYFIDYLDSSSEEIRLSDFKSNFHSWLNKNCAGDEAYEKWISCVGARTDFRPTIIECARFLWSQATYLDVMTYKKFVVFQELGFANPKRLGDHEEETIVTPTVYRWFEDIFGDQLKIIEHKDNTTWNDKESSLSDNICVNNKEFKIGNVESIFLPQKDGICHQVEIDSVIFSIGDVVELQDDKESGWTDGDKWLCLITEFIENRNEVAQFRMLWMYTRSQTVLSNLDEDFHRQSRRELFFTKHCECDKAQPLTSIKRKVKVNFFASSCPGKSLVKILLRLSNIKIELNKREISLVDEENYYFCRYFYKHTEGDFLTLPKEFLNPSKLPRICGCTAEKKSPFENFIEKYEIGDCILIPPQDKDPKNILTVACIEEIVKDRKIIKLRRFYRWFEIELSNKESTHPINELLYSKYIFEYDEFDNDIRLCHVEYLKFGDPLPVNLQHRGSANHFFFSRKYNVETREIKPLKSSKFADLFPDYYYKVSDIEKLRGLDLFCGGGSLGRGFEDAGFVECHWAVDKYEAALMTYRENASDNITLIHESVNKVLQDVISQPRQTKFPKKGDVDIILAGSPCQGFSKMNYHKYNEKTQQNNSLVTSLASFVDYYHPKYVLLENVAIMAKSLIFMRLIACLLELGYQIRFGLVSAESMGCAQSRCRIFLWGAAENEVLPEMPPITHRFSKSYKGYATTFKLPNKSRLDGLTVEENPITSFPLITVKKLIGDLPELDTGIFWNPQYPDHIPHNVNYLSKELLRRIPSIGNADYYSARQMNLIPEIFHHPSYEAKKKRFADVWKKLKYRYCQRVDGDSHPQIIHYEEPRTLSVREVARGQGFLDSDIICGSIYDQYKIIGNSVPRNVAFSLGSELGRALTDPHHKSLPENLLND